MIFTHIHIQINHQLSEFNKVLDKYYRSEEPNITYYKDIQYNGGDKIEVTLDWFEGNDTVELEVLK